MLALLNLGGCSYCDEGRRCYVLIFTDFGGKIASARR